MRTPARLWLCLPLLALCGCASNLDQGQSIKDLSTDDTRPKPQAVQSAPVKASSEQALQNYEKLLDLPQDPATRAETMRRLADLQLEQDEASGATLEQSEQRLRRTVALYEAVLKEQPQAPGNDRVLYQLARAHQNLGEADKAEVLLQRLVRDYPASPYADDAHFRRAELLFRLNQFDEAADEYRTVLAKGNATPFYETAEYKYGWSEYKQSEYDEALKVFFRILDRELPPGPQSDPRAAVAAVAAGKRDLAQDAVRVISLSFATLGGGDAAAKWFAAHGEPAYSPMIYAALGAHLLEKKRYTDSARTYDTFVATHPTHELGPAFVTKAIGAQDLGGFTDLVVEEKQRYVRLFDPAAPYWVGKPATPEVLKDLRTHLEDLARFFQARAQKAAAPVEAPAAEGAVAAAPSAPVLTDSARADYQIAAQYWQRLIALYPQDPEMPDLRFLLAESLFESGATLQAAEQFTRIATDYPQHEKAPEAAYAALLAYQRNAGEVPAAQQPAALKRSIDAALALAGRYPQHPRATAALTRAAEDLYRLKDYDRAVTIAAQVLQATPAPADEMLRTAWGVTADAQFSLKRYPEAERAYGELLQRLPADAPERTALGERLASAIYKQGEARRDAKDPRGAAEAFLRVGRAVPKASIRATADYDAAAMLIAAQDWSGAADVLEGFRAGFPQSPLLGEADKKLAVAYQNAGKPREAAGVLKRIAANGAEDTNTRREAAWLAVTLLDQAHDGQRGAEFEAYVRDNPQPLERAEEARQKLADIAGARGDGAARQRWLRELIDADTAGGAARTPRTKLLAAQATLEFARADARKASALALKLPLKQSLPAKKEAMERAIAALTTASDYGFAEVTTAATYELGALYQGFSKSLMASDRPRNLSALEREQYDLLLEEQAFPFEEKAIQWHEANLLRVPQGTYNEWVGKSLEALAQLAPGKYGKREQTAEVFDGLH